jgi:antitoxin component YwqK of YwqJK toxin-antitoxin module
MNKVSLTLLFFIALQSFFAQKILPENLSKKTKIYWDANKKHLHSTGSYYVDEINPETTEKHGKWLFYSLDGVLEEERFFYRNRQHGKQTVFFPNKTIKEIYYSRFNVPDSMYKAYNEKGVLLIQGNYQLGSPDGKWLFFYQDSSIWKTEFTSNDTTYLLDYFQDDSAHTQTVKEGQGFVKTYYSTGKTKESYTFSNGLKTGPFFELLASGKTSISGSFLKGKKDGVWEYFYADGTVQKREGYVADSLHGPYEVYYENGKPETVGQYVKGRKTGEWSWHSSQGAFLEMNGGFLDDLQHGDWEYYFSTGEHSYHAQFDHGKKTGEWNYHYRNGQDFRKGNYLNDLKTGLWQTWYEDGTLLMEGNYVNGKEEGEWKNNWPNGRVKNQSYYKLGKLNGAWYSFAPEGKLLLFGRYNKDLKTGKWTDFYNNGKKKEETSYKIKKVKNALDDVVSMGSKSKQSLEHGKHLAYSQVDYTLKESGKFKKGKKSGKWINYYPGGVVPAVVAYYKNGDLHGAFTQFDRMGNKMNEIHYHKGLKHGWFIVYGRNGKPISEKMFRYGHEMRKKNSEDGFAPN